MQDYAIFGSKRSLLVFGLFLLFLLIFGPSGTQAQAVINWTKYDNNIPANSDGSSTNGKIPLGTGGKGDDYHVQTPFVIKDGATYKMWYAGYDITTWRIYYATSSNGLEWTKYDNNIPAISDGSSTNGKIPLGTDGKGDDYGVNYQFVIKDGSTYKMWYGGSDQINWRTFYATSSNGLDWTKLNNTNPPASNTNSTDGRIPLGTDGKGDDYLAIPRSVIKDGPTYKMWYGGYDQTNWRGYYATSSNGLDWTKFDNTVPTNSDGSSTNGKLPLGSSGRGDDTGALPGLVIKEDSTYKMWYTGRSVGNTERVYYATSPNGLDWTKFDNTIPPDSNTTNSNSRIGLGTTGRGDRSVSSPVVVGDVSTSTYKMWYAGYDGANSRIYHATAPIPPPAGTIFKFH